MYSANWTVSPASPEKAIRVCLFSARVLSSEALRIVAPRIAALEAAMMVKSLPVRPSRTSLRRMLAAEGVYVGLLTSWLFSVEVTEALKKVRGRQG